MVLHHQLWLCVATRLISNGEQYQRKKGKNGHKPMAFCKIMSMHHLLTRDRFCETSAQSGAGVKEAFDKLFQMVLEIINK
jgi:hypothetical protein